MTSYLTGLPAWFVQRLSAIYLLAYGLFAGVLIATAAPLDFDRWHELMSRPTVAVATALAFIALLLHGWVGLRDVVLDYAGRHPVLRLVLLSLLGFWLLGLSVWMLRIIVGLLI